MATQVVVTITSAIVASLIDNPVFGVSVLWGGLAALANSVLLTWRLVGGDRPTYSAQQHLRLMYRSSLERFFVVTMMLALGVLRFKFEPLGVLLGFLAGQAMLVMVPLMRGTKS